MSKHQHVHRARIRRLAGLLGSLSIAGTPLWAQARPLQIDASQSYIRYESSLVICDPFLNCTSSPAQTFQISGDLQVGVRKTWLPVNTFPPVPGIELNLIDFTPLSLDLNGADTLGFLFPTYSGILNGDTFSGNENPCTFDLLGGFSCMSIGYFGQFEGSYDGETLSLEGTDPLNSPFDTFTYHIVARAVPEPGTLSLLALAGAGGLLLRRRRSGYA